jgi:Ca-activated chloride channel family protein
LDNAREKASEGITLSTIGFGLGEYNDQLMEQIADNGDGSYYYIDNLRQARRVFVHQLTGTLQVIAFEARIQVDFNPDVVAEYRLIGYENRAIADADFRNDAEVDAAEIGAGHSVTGLYEIRLHPNAPNDKIATVYVRYQNADTMDFEEVNQDFPADSLFSDFSDMPATFRLHAVVAEFGEMLRGAHPDGDYVELLSLANPLVNAFEDDPDVAEFVDLIRLAGQYVDVGR